MSNLYLFVWLEVMMIPSSLLDLSQSRKLSDYQLHTTLYTRKLFETRLSSTNHRPTIMAQKHIPHVSRSSLLMLLFYYPRALPRDRLSPHIIYPGQWVRVMGLISPIDKNARDVTSTTHVLASWRIFSCTGFFFFLIFMLFAFVFGGAFAVFPYVFVSVGLFARVCKISWEANANT